MTFGPVATKMALTRVLFKSDLTFSTNWCDSSFLIKQISNPNAADTFLTVYDYSSTGAIGMTSSTGNFYDINRGPFYTFDASKPVKKVNLALNVPSNNNCD